MILKFRFVISNYTYVIEETFDPRAILDDRRVL